MIHTSWPGLHWLNEKYGHSGAAAGAEPSTLLDGLVSLWRLDETSGTRADQVGSNALTDNNTVGYATGIIGNAASFVSANSEWLSSSATANANPDSDFTMAFWVNPTTHTGYIAAKDTGAGNRVWEIQLNSGGGSSTRWTVFGAGQYTAEILGTLAGAWHLVAVKFVVATKTLSLRIDNGSWTSAVLTGTPETKTIPIYLGAVYSGPILFYNGLMDVSALWSRELTDDEHTELYNSGAGFDPTA